ncbi:MAG: ABC transporter substrate-binding protein [Myxococcales bacterium]
MVPMDRGSRFLFPLLCAAAASAPFAAASAAPKAPVKIGIINSMTGPEAPLGAQLTYGFKLAEEDLKAAGNEVQLVWQDDVGKPQVTMTSFEKLATSDEVAGIVGPYSSAAASAAAKAAERYRVPLLIPSASKEEITRQGLKWTFRISATTADRASILIDMALALGKPKTIAILTENTDFGTAITKATKTVAEKKGLKIVFEDSYSKGSPDYRSALAKMKDAKPDLVILASYVVDAILIMRQSREMGLEPMAFLSAGAGFAVSQFTQEKQISEGVFSSADWAPDTSWPGAREWSARFEKRFGLPPTYQASGAYASLMIMGEVAVKARGNREKVRELLRAGKWNGIFGEVTFRDFAGFNNQNDHEMIVQQARDGRYETVWPPNAATHKPLWPFPGWK